MWISSANLACIEDYKSVDYIYPLVGEQRFHLFKSWASNIGVHFENSKNDLIQFSIEVLLHDQITSIQGLVKLYLSQALYADYPCRIECNDGLF